MVSAEYRCSENDPIGPFFAIHDPIGTNIFTDRSVMQAGAARHIYRSPLLPKSNPFADADVFSGEEIVLGILSLFIISLLSSLVYDILLRGGRKEVYSTKAVSIATALESVERWGFDPTHAGRDEESSRNTDRQYKLHFKGILIVVILATVTFSLEVALIVATQQVDVPVTGETFGFTLTTPILARWGMGQFLRRNAPTRPCITPSISGGGVEWRARVQTCFTVNYTDDVTHNARYSGRMQYRSIYHRRGGDHFLTALDIDLTYALSVRTKLYRENAGPVEVLRSPLQDEMDTALMVHLTAPIYYATNRIRRESKTCSEMQINPLEYKHWVTKKNVTIGQIENGPLVEEGTVYMTEFDLDVEDIEWWMVQGLGSAAASAGVSLTVAPTYLMGRTAEVVTIDDVVYVSKERRFTAPSLAIALGLLLLIKIFVRLFLKPVSLFEVARMRAQGVARIEEYEGTRDTYGSKHIDMRYDVHELGASYGRPPRYLWQWDNMSYEDARKYFVALPS